jgi:hypothetical protein
MAFHLGGNSICCPEEKKHTGNQHKYIYTLQSEAIRAIISGQSLIHFVCDNTGVGLKNQQKHTPNSTFSLEE